MIWTAEWRQLGHRLQSLLPATLLGLLVLVTYWLQQNSPILSEALPENRSSTKPDAYFYQFRIVGFDAQGQWLMQVSGKQARHMAHQDTYDIEQPRMIKRTEVGDAPMRLHAERALASDDGMRLELFGQAQIEQEAHIDKRGEKRQAQEIRSEYLLLDEHRHSVETHLPVTLTRGTDTFSANHMLAFTQSQQLQLDGRVRGTLAPRLAPSVGRFQ
jgi:lipopolysaccharide export system protein LptC